MSRGSTDPAQRNLAVYGEPATVRAYAATSWVDAWLCAGERVLIRRLAGVARGAPLLDIGVGAGRTTGLLTLITDDYVGIDFSPDMVQAAIARHPDADIRVGDARDLSEFADDHFGAAVFSFNGIDSVSHDDRRRVFAEIRRVLRPGGLLFYSTLNKGSARRLSKPWRDLGLGSRAEWAELNLTQRVRRTAKTVAVAAHRLQMVPSWSKSRRLEEERGSWGMHTLAAHRFKLLNHFITAPAARAELDAAGFALLDMVDWDGSPIGDGASPTSSFFILAKKSAQTDERGGSRIAASDCPHSASRDEVFEEN